MATFQTSPLFLLYVVTFFVAAIACFASLTRLPRITDSDTRRGLWSLLLTSGGWALAHVGFLVSPTTSLKLVWYTLGLVVGLAAVGAWLYFCSAFTGRSYHQNPTYRRLAVATYIVLIAVKITNPLHHEYFTATTVAEPFSHLSVYTGPLHWTAMGLSYALAFVGYFMLLELFTDIDLDTRPLFALVGVTALPVAFDLIGYTTPFLLDITYEPLGVAVFAVGVGFVYVDRFDAVQLAAERDVPVIALDANDHIRDTNRTAQNVFPELAAARGSLLAETLPRVANCLESDDPILALDQIGQTRYFHVTENPYGTTKGGLGRTIVFTDVTDRERYRTELERQNERLDQFASVVSHDLRNPLNVAEGRLELAQEECDSEHLEAIDAAIDRIDRITEDVLLLAREGRDIGAMDDVVLGDAIEAAWNIVADRTEHAELRYEDDAVATATIKADYDRLGQLFENLFRNAIDHGGEAVTVTVGAIEGGFYVEDDGPGIPSESRTDVFTAGHSTEEEGTGFGLSIVKQISDAHSWDISITEGSEGGARFEITGVQYVTS